MWKCNLLKPSRPKRTVTRLRLEPGGVPVSPSPISPIPISPTPVLPTLKFTLFRFHLLSYFFFGQTLSCFFTGEDCQFGVSPVSYSDSDSGVGETRVGEMGQIIGETGIGETGVGETGTNRTRDILTRSLGFTTAPILSTCMVHMSASI